MTIVYVVHIGGYR